MRRSIRQIEETVLDKEARAEVAGRDAERVLPVEATASIIQEARAFNHKLDMAGENQLKSFITKKGGEDVYQIMVLSTTYGWAIQQAIEVVEMNHSKKSDVYGTAVKISEMLQRLGIGFERAKEFVEQGYTSETAKRIGAIMNQLVREYCLSENEAYKTALNFGEVASEIIGSSKWDGPYQKPGEDIRFVTFAEGGKWFVTPNISNEPRGGLIAKIQVALKKNSLNCTRMPDTKSEIYFVNDDFWQPEVELEELTEKLVKYARNISNLEPMNNQEPDTDPHIYEHMDTTRLSSDRI